MLKIYKASAGAGKTHELTQQYLNLLFQSEHAYRHILAVTFTNKATDEMKQRILQELFALSDKTGDPHQGDAQRLLISILNDYSAFQVSTIDRFFQRIMRSFARELGQASNYCVELDQDRVLSEAIDEMMNGLEDQPDLLKWLITLSLDNIEQGNSWDATGKLKEMGKRLFSEEYKLKSRDLEDRMRDKPSVLQFSEQLQELVDELHPRILENDKTLTDEQRRDYHTAEVILTDLYAIALFADIREHLVNFCRENNLVLLSETNDFLNRLIGQDDTPFVYEKVGTRLNHYMLDEFQDTSTLQWKNFEPLLKDSLDNGRDNLVVGDVKQSIYRWRNSDWELLNHKVFQKFGSDLCRVIPKRENWRSGEYIVEFNNEFFRKASDAVQLVYNKERKYDQTKRDGDAGLINQIFADVKQEVVPKHLGHGRVSLQFVDKESVKDWKAAIMERLPEVIREVLSRGYHQRDITFLVRTNSEGSVLSKSLMSNGFHVVTEESLSLSASNAVVAIVTQLKEMLDQGSVPEDVSLYALCESLVRDLPEEERAEQIFIRTFMDAVLDFSMGFQGGNLKDLLTWWDEKGSRLCVNAPEGEDALRVMTVHKAKGLAAPIIILPFFDEVFTPKGRVTTYIWANPQRPPFNYLPILPLLAKKELQSTWFEEEYWKERLYHLVDLLNVAYVAFTRAREEMIVMGPQPKRLKKGGYSILSLSNVLFKHYEQELIQDGPWMTTEIGKVRTVAEGAEGESVRSNTVADDSLYRSVPIGARLRLTLKGADFFSEDSQRTRGVVMHEILSRIEVADQLEDSVRLAVSEGVLPQEEFEDVLIRLKTAIEGVQQYHWFDGTYCNYNELSILDENGVMVCPDRVMFRDQEAVVLDYKFGQVERPQYHDQVTRYKEKVAQMGRSVRGYLWYVTLNKVVEI